MTATATLVWGKDMQVEELLKENQDSEIGNRLLRHVSDGNGIGSKDGK